MHRVSLHAEQGPSLAQPFGGDDEHSDKRSMDSVFQSSASTMNTPLAQSPATFNAPLVRVVGVTNGCEDDRHVVANGSRPQDSGMADDGGDERGSDHASMNMDIGSDQDGSMSSREPGSPTSEKEKLVVDIRK